MRLPNLLSRLLTTALVALTCVLSCSSSLQATSRSAAPKVSLPEVEVWVEGPWAYADDPRDPQRIVLIAPDSDSIEHTPAAVAHKTGDVELDSDSVLEIKSLTHTQQSCSTCSAINSQTADVNKQALVKLLDSKKGRYVISLPKPDSYEEAVGQESRVRSAWWDNCRPNNCGPQRPRTTQMIFHYTVSSLDGFSVGPTPQTQTSLKFQDRHIVTIFMTAKGEIDDCDSGGRLAFRELVRLFSLNLYVDLRIKSTGPYPSDDPPGPSPCLDGDPQNPGNSDAQKPAYKITRSLAGALEDLANYVLDPGHSPAVQARADWNQVNHYRNLVTTEHDRQQFDESMANLNNFLTSIENAKKITADSSATISALQNLEIVRKLIPFHNGSGACRNPLLQLNPV